MPAVVIENLAKGIYDKTLSKVTETDKSIDPITIIIIIAIIVNVIRVIQECNKSKILPLSKGEKVEFLSTDVKFRAFNHSFLTRVRIRKILKNQLNADQYKVYCDALVQTLLDVGKTVTEEQISALLEYKNV
jgi:hypothetical protein